MPLGASKVTLLGVAGASTAGSVVLLSTAVASSSASLSFTSYIDSTYGEYIFGLYSLHPSNSGGVDMQFNASADGGSNYNVTKTTTYFRAYAEESGGTPAVGYDAGKDLAQSSAYQMFNNNVGDDNDQSCVGELHLWNPSGTTYAKHFCYVGQGTHSTPATRNEYVAGYMNTTTAINAINFKFSAGNIDAGTIKMWGVL